jgi:hypothetical protein
MPTYDLKCSFCGYEEERMLPITRDLEEFPLGCTDPMAYRCAGVMEKLFKKPPCIHPRATPSRRKDDGVKYRETNLQTE